MRRRPTLSEQDMWNATVENSVLTLRPKLMTVTVVMASLVPMMWGTGVGSDVMKPIAAPIIAGMITSTIHVFVITPVISTSRNDERFRREVSSLEDAVGHPLLDARARLTASPPGSPRRRATTDAEEILRNLVDSVYK